MDANGTINGETSPKKRGRPKGLPKTGGRVKGQPPLIPADLRAVCREVLGLDNLAIRKRLQQRYESGEGLDSTTFRHILLMGYGQPKHAMESGETLRKPVIFLGIPWDPSHPHNARMDARSRAMNEAKAEEEKLRALEAGKPEIIDVESVQGEPKADEPEGLERVIEPPNDHPSAFR